MSSRRASAHFSLRSILIFLFGSLLVATIVTLLLVVNQMAKKSLVREQSIAMEALATQVANRLNNNLNERLRELTTAASIRRATGPMLQNYGVARAWLNNLKANYTLYAWIGFADIKGKVLVSTEGLLEGSSVAERPWHKQGLRRHFIGDVHKAVLLADLMEPRDEPWRFLDVAVPVYNGDEDVVGVLGAHLSDEWFDQITADALKTTLRYKPVEAFVLDSEGKVVLGPDNLQHQEEIQGMSLPRDQDKPFSQLVSYSGEEEYLMAALGPSQHERLKDLDWMIVVRQPSKDALAAVYALQTRIIQTGLGLFVATILLAYAFSVWVNRPLRSAAEGAQKFAKGQNMPDILEARYREGAELVEALQSMMRDIRSHEIELEGKVLERTQELAASLKRIEVNERQMRTITDNLPVQIAYIDAKERMVFFNSAYQMAFRLDIEMAQWKTLEEIMPEDVYRAIRPFVRQALTGNRVKFEYTWPGEDQTQHFESQYIPDFESNGIVTGLFALVTDITELREQQNRLQWQVQHDSLTGALNRQGLQVVLELAVERSLRYETGLALMFIDLDRFKAVNDTYGHGVGDELLKTTVARLKEVVRKSDSVARIAGDEFVVVLENLQEPESNAQHVATSILEKLNLPLENLPYALHIEASIGVACTHGKQRISTDSLVKKADAAMYKAKELGRNQFCILSI